LTKGRNLGRSLNIKNADTGITSGRKFLRRKKYAMSANNRILRQKI